MRASALALLALAVTGCPTQNQGGDPDMLVPPDLTVTPQPDLTAVPDLSGPQPDLTGIGTSYAGNLRPAQEVPPVVEAENGTVTATLNGTATQLDLTATFTLGQATFMMAHVHKAAAGVNGGVVKDLPAPVGGTITLAWKSTDGTQPLTPALVGDLDAGALYVNIHTNIHSSGHMRAQLTRTGETLYIARMTPGQETPPVTGINAAGGVGYFWNANTMKLRHYGEFSSLTGNPSMAHIHKAAAGVAGGPVYTIPGLPAATTGFFKGEADFSALVGAVVGDLDGKLLYINIHTSANPNGEIRGQLSEKF